MKSLSIILFAAVFTMVFFSAQEALAGRIFERQLRQQKRIHHGMKSGQVTNRETRYLQKEQRCIQRKKQKAWRDGKLTCRERSHLEKIQDRAGRHIYRMKQNKARRQV